MSRHIQTLSRPRHTSSRHRHTLSRHRHTLSRHWHFVPSSTHFVPSSTHLSRHRHYKIDFKKRPTNFVWCTLPKMIFYFSNKPEKSVYLKIFCLKSLGQQLYIIPWNDPPKAQNWTPTQAKSLIRPCCISKCLMKKYISIPRNELPIKLIEKRFIHFTAEFYNLYLSHKWWVASQRVILFGGSCLSNSDEATRVP